MDEYINFFKDLNASLEKDFKKVNIEFQVVGYVALALAGLIATRGTKDVDALKTKVLAESKNAKLIKQRYL